MKGGTLDFARAQKVESLCAKHGLELKVESGSIVISLGQSPNTLVYEFFNTIKKAYIWMLGYDSAMDVAKEKK